MKHLLLLLLAAASTLVPGTARGTPQNAPPADLEEFALAEDRAQVVERMLPGTESRYFYGALLALQQGRFSDFDRLAAEWEREDRRSQALAHLWTRRQLLGFEVDPERTWQYWIDRLDLAFAHRAPGTETETQLPSAIAPEDLSDSAFLARSISSTQTNFSAFPQAGLLRVDAAALSSQNLGGWLSALQWPTYPGLVEHVVRDLAARSNSRFGDRPIHRSLTLEQLDAVWSLAPAVAKHAEFRATYESRLAPSADELAEPGNDAHEAHLERLEAFVKRLPDEDPTLRGRVLYQRLVHNAARDVFDEAVLLEYLRLPHLSARTHPDRRLGRSVASPTFAPGEGETEFVHELLLRALVGRGVSRPYDELLASGYLLRTVAEANLLAGADPAVWQTRLQDPQFLMALERRVEVRFPFSRPTEFHRDEELAFDVQLKNVPTLHVKVYRLDPLTRFAEGATQIRADIDLDGLVPHFERRIDYAFEPMVRHNQRLTFPECSAPGWYAIEVLGNGVASRVLAQKGSLAADVRLSVAGHVVRVVDEGGNHLKDARVWLDGAEFAPDPRGDVLVPFASERTARHLVLSHSNLAQRVPFDHREEHYELSLGAHVERETLLQGVRAPLLLRPSLRVHDAAASLALLEDTSIEIVTVRHDGVRSVKRIEKPVLRADEEFVAEFEVPANLSGLEVRMRAHVRRLTDGVRQELVGEAPRFVLNRSASRGDVASVLLGREGSLHYAELVGRNGEPLVKRFVGATLVHRDFPNSLAVQLESDETGRLQLGDLSSIASIHLNVANLGSFHFALDAGATPWPVRVHTMAAESSDVGTTVRLPLPLQFQPKPNDPVLLELGTGVGFVRDLSDRVRFASGQLEIDGLPPGDYLLALPTLKLTTQVSVAKGSRTGAHVQNAARRLQLPERPEPAIRRFDVQGDVLRLEVSGAGADSRVHLIARRRAMAYDGRAGLAGPPKAALDTTATPHGDVEYLLERRLSDEERYILERRFAKQFLGNPLERAGLLLQPWSADESKSDEIGMGSGGGGGSRGRRSGRFRGPGDSPANAPHPATGPLDADMDYFPSPALVLANLRLDADGARTVPLADLGVEPGGLHHLEAILVHRTGALSAELALPTQPLTPRDRRLQDTLDAEAAVHQARTVDFVRAGDALRLDPENPGNHALYGSLKDVFDLFQVLGNDLEFAKFRFVVDWPGHSDERKRELYSEFACHELHVFLREKDPAFFEEVVLPYLANKGQPTFLDDWLLERDLTPYLETRRMRALNTAEQVLLLRRTDADLASFAGELQRRAEGGPDVEDERRQRFETALARASLDPERNKVRGESGDFFLGQGVHRGPGATPPTSRSATTGGPATGGPLRSTGTSGIVSPAERSAEAQVDDVEIRDPEVEENMPFDSPENANTEIGLSADLERRADAPHLYRPLAPTRVLRETHWWKRPLADGSPPTTAVRFWRDLALADPNLPFHSPHFVDATSSSAEMLLALAFLDLGFAQDAPVVRADEKNRMTADRDLLLLRRELVVLTPGDSSLLVAADLFDPASTTDTGSAPPPADVRQLLAGVPYGMRVVLSNPSNRVVRAELLLQLPTGSFPLYGAAATRAVPVEVPPFGTKVVEARFYFPTPGEFAHTPGFVSANTVALVGLEPQTVLVSASLPKARDPFGQLAATGSLEEVVTFLGTAPVESLPLSALAWRMGERPAFDAVLDVLRRRFAFDGTLWSYGFLHRDLAAASEYLVRQSRIVNELRPWIESPLLSLDPGSDFAIETLEFAPLVNARAHANRHTRAIANQGASARYVEFLELLRLRPALTDRDRLELSYHMLIQERLEEAIAALERVERDRIAEKLQYDYLAAHLAASTGDTARARALCEPHRNHPVLRWQKLFRAALEYLDRAEGKGNEAGAGEQPTLPPSLALDLEVIDTRVRVQHRGASELVLSFTPVDLELNFSKAPFPQRGGVAASGILPHRRMDVPAEPAGGTLDVAIPEDLASRSLLVELRAGGAVRRALYQPTQLVVHFEVQRGQLEARDREGGAPLAGAYVKVYAEDARGTVRFHRDGYTDLLGRFDYTSVSTSAPWPRRFAVLVLHEERGALVREIVSPTR